MSETEATAPPMEPDERKDFVRLLLNKLSYVLSVRALGKDVSAAEQAVEHQISDTIKKGNPQKS